jgi:hypothetical protein
VRAGSGGRRRHYLKKNFRDGQKYIFGTGVVPVPTSRS